MFINYLSLLNAVLVTDICVILLSIFGIIKSRVLREDLTLSGKEIDFYSVIIASSGTPAVIANLLYFSASGSLGAYIGLPPVNINFCANPC